MAKYMILLVATVGMVVVGFAESRQADKVLQEDFTRRLADVEMCLEVKDGEQCLLIYHEMLKKGYRLTEGDKRNVESAFEIYKRDYNILLKRAIRGTYNEELVRKRWTEITALYNDLTSKQHGDADSKAKKQPEPRKQPSDKRLDDYFKRKRADVEMSLEVNDGEQCLRIYHEIWKKGYRLAEDDNENVETAFEICKEDYKAKLRRAIGNPHFKEEDVRKWWSEILSIYNDLTGKR